MKFGINTLLFTGTYTDEHVKSLTASSSFNISNNSPGRAEFHALQCVGE